MINLFDPPPLQAMTLRQKAGRVILLTSTLVIVSTLVAMLGALGLFIGEQGYRLGNMPQFFNGLAIIVVAVAVNVTCVILLLKIRHADGRLMAPHQKSSDV